MAQEKLTRGTKKIIIEAIAHLPLDKKTNEYAICEEVSNILVDRFVSNKEIDSSEYNFNRYALLDYQVKRMGLSTTFEIMDKIELYMLSLLKNNNGKSDP